MNSSAQHALLATTMNSMRKEGTLCDVTLVVQGQHFIAHRAVLAAASKFFTLMFTTPMIESTSREVELQDVDPSVIEELLEFIYTGRITINGSNVVSLLKASNQYQIEPVKEMCARFLSKQVDSTNCLDIFSMADYMSCQELKELAEDFFLLHFTDLYKKDEFLQLHWSQIVHLLHQDKLIAESEIQISIAALCWLNYDLSNRKKHAAEVLGCVRFAFIKELCFQEYRPCMEMLLNVGIHHLVPDRWQQNNHPRCQRSLFAVFGGQSSMKTYYFNPQYCTWAKIQDCPIKSLHESTAVFCKNVVYIMGGRPSYNVLENRWQRISAQPMKKDFAAACASEGKIYRSGGTVCGLSVTHFDCFNPKTNTWQVLRRMLSARDSHPSVEVKGLIYVCGGTMRNSASSKILSKCEVYNPSTQQWTEICRMNEARKNHGLVVVNDQIYALGGHGTKGALNSVEVYDIGSNKWHCASPMPWRGVSVKCAAVGRLIYVLAGRACERTPLLKHVLVYHTHSDRWVIRHKTQAFPYSSCLVCVINEPLNHTVTKKEQYFKTFKVRESL